MTGSIWDVTLNWYELIQLYKTSRNVRKAFIVFSKATLCDAKNIGLKIPFSRKILIGVPKRYGLFLVGQNSFLKPTIKTPEQCLLTLLQCFHCWLRKGDYPQDFFSTALFPISIEEKKQRKFDETFSVSAILANVSCEKSYTFAVNANAVLCASLTLLSLLQKHYLFFFL